uniref:Uncharacterized protein n=1 Tax=Arundo donax TaxID=35708 RepID=A0A0A8YIK9_ARUDO
MVVFFNTLIAIDFSSHIG